MDKTLINKDTSNNSVFAKAKTNNCGNYHTDHLDNKVNFSAKHLVLLMPCGYRLNRAAHNIMKKSEKSIKLNIVKCKDLRVYKDNARPTIFDDKRRKEKHKGKIYEIYEIYEYCY